MNTVTLCDMVAMSPGVSAVLAIAMCLSVCLSVCLSITSRYCIEQMRGDDDDRANYWHTEFLQFLLHCGIILCNLCIRK